MPYIEPRCDQNGEITHYRINVSAGVNYKGQPIKHRTTWRPKPGISRSQAEREIKAFAYKFEKDIHNGYQYDDNKTFAQYADYVLDLKARNGLAPSTLDRYNSMLPRINEAIGHIKLNKIRPQHLNDFYQNLMEHGVREDNVRAIAKHSLRRRFKEEHISKAELARRSSLGAMTITAALRGDPLRLTSAEAIARSMGYDVSDLFTIRNNEIPLSAKTVLEHHRLISMILEMAVKEQLVPYNAAARATPPKVSKKEADYFQPEEVADIVKALENIPIKWKTMSYILIDTGCRRGELMGLQWHCVDLDKGIMMIKQALLYTKDKGVYVGPPKTGRPRAVCLAPETIEVLKKWKTEQLLTKIRHADVWQDTGFIFTKDDGSAMHPDSITDWLNKFSEANDLPHTHPHAFRHTVASILISNGIDPVTTANELGHADANTTQAIYAQQIVRARAEASGVRAGVFSVLREA